MEGKKSGKILFLAVSVVLMGLVVFYFRESYPKGMSSLNLKVMGALLIMLAAVAVLALVKINKKVLMTAMLVAFAGLFFFVTPASEMHDADYHYFRAYEISEGHFLARVYEDGSSGDELPEGIRDWEDPANNYDFTKREEVEFSNASIYAPFAYWPQSLGLFVGRLFSSNAAVITMFGRFFTIAICMALCIFALWKMPFGTEIMFLVMMFPMALQEYSTFSADGVTNAVAFAFVAEVLSTAYGDKNVSSLKITMLTLLGMWLSITKIMYIVLVPLVCIIPWQKIGSKRKSTLVKAIWMGLPVLFIVAWMLFCIPYLAGSARGDMGGQVSSMIGNFPKFATSIIRTIFDNADFYVGSMIGSKLNAANATTAPIMWISYLVLLIVTSVKSRFKNTDPHRFDRVFFIIIFCVAIFVNLACLFIQWTTAKDKGYIAGFQGRYLIPVLILPLLCFTYKNRDGKAFAGTYFYVLVAFLAEIGAIGVLRMV